MIIRTECVICNKIDSFEHLYTLKQFPLRNSHGSLDTSSDKFMDCIFVNCTSCGTAQLQTLIDPIILYSDSHNSTENTPSWKSHHRLFADFVLKNTNAKSILEVGGNTGVLYMVIRDSFIKYKILDICNDKYSLDDVFIEGNCETFDFTGYTDIILSHTFEHLYSPKTFFNNIIKGGIKSVYISIPNMEYLYTSKNISLITIEHTFFLGNDEIRYLFSKNNFTCNAFYEFKNHSLFYHFVYNESVEPLTLNINIERSKEIKKYIGEFESSIEKFIINKPCFICPGGHYGQKVYYYLKKYSNYIMGFIDNDPSKHNTRIYGTSACVYSPDILASYKNTRISILLYAGPYTAEIKNQLNMIHPSIEYIML